MNHYDVVVSMVLKFNLDIIVSSEKWSDDAQKETFIENFTDVVQQGLMRMTVPDWTVKNVTVEEVEE